MPVDITNIGVPMVISRGFVPLAVQSGMVELIHEMVSYATDKRSLLIALKTAVAQTSEAFAVTLNYDTLDALLRYINTLEDSPIMTYENLPLLLNEDGPASVTAVRNGGTPTTLDITYSEPPSGYTAEIYLDEVFVQHDTVAAVTGTVTTTLEDVEVTGHSRRINILFRNPDGNQTRFGTIVTVA